MPEVDARTERAAARWHQAGGRQVVDHRRPLSHITDENIDEEAARAGRAVYQSASVPIMPRSRAQIEGFFDGLDLLPPGLTGSLSSIVI
jgi:S-adenosyl methyltransferase